MGEAAQSATPDALGEHSDGREIGEERGPSGESRELSQNDLFDMLSNPRRRELLSILCRGHDPLTIEDASTRLAAIENDVAQNDLAPEQYKRVYTALYQCHLPRMDEIGVIEFDTSSNTIHSCDELRSVRPYLEKSNHGFDQHIELLVAGVVAGIVLLGTGGIGPFTNIPQTALVGLTISALFGISILGLLIGVRSR